MLNLHRNENTSIAAARAFVTVRGGSVSWLEPVPSVAFNTRTVAFSCFNVTFAFDPNRIFTPSGAMASLKMYSARPVINADLVDKVVNFGKQVLDLYGWDKHRTVIAIHNNGPGFSIDSYRAGGEFASDAAQLNVADNATLRNFFLVTQLATFQSLVAAEQNVVLQATNATDDGSLSYLAALQSKNYVNIEGRAAQGSDGSEIAMQVSMFVALLGDVPSACGAWQTGTIVLGLVALLLGATLLVVGVSVYRQRRKAAGYESIEKNNTF
jgi:hypothetical protein